MLFILFSGKFGAGKTISASYVASALGGKKMSFATKVKKIAFEFGWDGNKDERGRKLLQEIGKLGRNYNKDYWALTLIDSALQSDYDIITVDDWRFPNEVDVCSKYGKVVRIRVYRDSILQYADSSLYNDESENSLPEESVYYDFTVDNNGTFENLYEKLDEIVEKIKKGWLA